MIYVPQNLKHEGEDVRFMLANVFSLDEDTIELARQAFFRVLFRDEFERVDDNEAVPQTGMDLLFGQPPLQLHEDFRCIDNVHLDQIFLKTVTFPTAFQLMRLNLE